jgi:thioredoxin-like negative regulator of GroEL
MAHILQVVDNTFDAQVFKTDIPVLVGFRAAWCRSWQPVESVLEDIVGRYAGRLKVVAVDVDESNQAAFRHRVQSVPTLILFANGQEVERLEGGQATSGEALLSRVVPHLRLD